MSRKTQGTEVWAFNPATKELIDLGCIDSLSGLGATTSQVTVTCLRDLYSRSEPGLIEAGEMSFTLQFDPQNPDHIKLHKYQENGNMLDFSIGFRHEVDGVVQVPGPAPTYDSVGNKVEIPEERDWILASGYISAFPFDFQQNDVVRSAVTVQISGPIYVSPAVPPAP